MRLNVKLFAILRERAGRSELELDLPAGATVAEAVGQLIDALPVLQAYVSRAAYAVNRDYVKPTSVLSDGDELALIPPVSGG